MQPNQVPQAPPPYQPATQSQNPYEFITSSGQPKKRLLPSGSAKGRIITVLIGIAVLSVIAILVSSLLNRGGANLKADYTTLAQQQTELIRISDIGVSKARQSQARNLAITTKLSLVSQQPETLKLAKKAGADTKTKALTLGKDEKTTALLTNADQSNQFDSVFIQTTQAKLKTYQQSLKKVYDGTSSKSTKTTMSKYYDEVTLLIGAQPNSGGTSSSPATN